MGILPSTSFEVMGPNVARGVAHPINGNVGKVNSFLYWGPWGPEPAIIESTIELISRGVTPMDGSGYMSYGGIETHNTITDPYLAVGSASSESVLSIKPSTPPTFNVVSDQITGNLTGHTSSGQTFSYRYVYVQYIDNTEFPRPVSDGFDTTFSPTYGQGSPHYMGYMEIEVPNTGPAGTDFTILYRRDNVDYDREYPASSDPNLTLGWRQIGIVAGNGGEFVDNFLNSELRAEQALTDTFSVFQHAWRSLMLFDTSGITGTIQTAWLKLMSYPPTHGIASFEIYVTAGTSTLPPDPILGYGYIPSGGDYAKPTSGSPWVYAGHAVSKGAGQIGVKFNQNGIDELNRIVEGAWELHVGLVKVGEDHTDTGYYKCYSGDGSSVDQRPHIDITLAEIAVVGGFPGKLNRGTLELVGL